MKKYLELFFKVIVLAILLFFTFGKIFEGGTEIETIILAIGSVILLLLSYLITQAQYIIDLLKKNK